MNENKIDFGLLHSLATPLARVCSRFAFVGEVNKDWKNLTKIHILSSLNKEVENSADHLVFPYNTLAIDENNPLAKITYRAYFDQAKIAIENFMVDKDVELFHAKYPEVSIVVEEVTEKAFPFAELWNNSSNDFYDYVLNDWNVFEDPIIRGDFSVEDRYTGKEYHFKNERELMELNIHHYIPVHLRF